VVTGLFKWGSRSAQATLEPEGPGDAPGTVAASKVLPRFLSVLSLRPAPVLLDLGPVVGPNISFFGDQFACKIHVADLYAEVETHARAESRDGLPAAMAARIGHPPESIDGILCWDLFDFLDKKTGAALAAKLVSVLKPGGVIYGFFGQTTVQLTEYTRYIVESPTRFRLRPVPAAPVTRSVILNRDLIRMFGGLAVAESVLLKNSTRETLFRKPS
jgi:hypothetical protein